MGIERQAIFGVAVLAALLGLGCAAAQTTLEVGEMDSPEGIDADVAAAAAEEPVFLWLEEVQGERALGWVHEQNDRTISALREHPDFDSIEVEAFEVLTSSEALVWPSLRGDYIYNFWRDEQNERGLWRRTSRSSYRQPEPEWQVLIDLDELAAEEDENWVWHGATCLYPTYDRCVITLSRGGSDAAVKREFDMETLSFVEGGFELPESKSRLSWIDGETVFVAPAIDDAQLTDSGYPRLLYRWSRGQALEEATLLLEGEHGDISVAGWRSWDGQTPYDFAYRAQTFYTRSYFLISDDGLHKVDIPADASVSAVHQGQLLIELKSAWEHGGEVYGAGTLLAAPIAGVLEGELEFSAVFVPDERQSIASVSTTQGHLLVTLLDEVRGRLLRFTFEDNQWLVAELSTPAMGDLTLLAADDQSDAFYYSYADFLTPTTIFEADAAVDEHQELSASPSFFDSSQMRVEQRHARSADGTSIPYFVVFPGADGPTPAPVLLYAYGGFEVSQTPFYSGVMGRSWLARGGVYVVANIRGGGEFGPEWHTSALRENRQRSFDDLIAVAEHLIETGVATPATLGIEGGSNGGLLTGAVMVQRPELFGAVISAVPLLDMLRYHRLLAGASWVAEYGDPEVPEDAEFLRAYSPLQNIREGADYPAPFIWTSTLDDRVHPGHARRMSAQLQALGHQVFYYENTEGGHGGAANQRQRAFITAMKYSYLFGRLSGAGR